MNKTIESFDVPELPALTTHDVLDLAKDSANFRLRLQPHLRRIAVQHPVDDLCLAVTKGNNYSAMASPLFAKVTGAQIPVDGGNDRVI